MTPTAKDQIEFVTPPIHELIVEFAKNAQHITPAAQGAIAKYIDYQSTPLMFTHNEGLAETIGALWRKQEREPSNDIQTT